MSGAVFFRIDERTGSISARDTGVGARWLYIHVCTRVRNHSEAALYAGPFICGDKIQIRSTASARGPASICHGDATHRYRLARPRNYPRRARILQRTSVIYRAARRHVTPSRMSASSSLHLLFPLLILFSTFIFFPRSSPFPDDRVNFHSPT